MQKSLRVIQILEGYESLLEDTYLIPVPTETVEEKYVSGKILEFGAINTVFSTLSASAK